MTIGGIHRYKTQSNFYEDEIDKIHSIWVDPLKIEICIFGQHLYKHIFQNFQKTNLKLQKLNYLINRT